MYFGDLFQLLEQRALEFQDDTDYTGLTEELASLYVAQLGIGTDGKSLLGIRTESFQNLIPSDAQHPVIVYMAGFNGMGFENYKVLEKLAQNGFIVIAIGSVGRYPGDMTNQKEDMLEQVYDAEFVIEHFIEGKTAFHVDSSRIGILGCSWGGMSAAVFASRNPNIGAMISLDGTETHYFGETDANIYADGASGLDNDRFIREIHDSNLLDPKSQTFDYLYLESGDKVDEFRPTSEYHYYKEFDNEKYYLRFANSTHSDFVCIPSILNSSEETLAIYGNIEKVSINFFNTTLNGTGAFQPFWTDLSARPNTTNQPFDIEREDERPTEYTIKGLVVDKNTSSPLPFVNIGVLNQDWGTVTDARGAFSLRLKEDFRDDTLRFSMIGYNSLETIIGEIDMLDSLVVHIEESLDELQEVVVTAKALKARKLGNKTESKFLGTGFGYDQLGAEMGIKIKVRHQPTFVDAFNFTITYNRLSAVTIFRLNFYALENGEPGKNILKENIFIPIDPQQTGSISFDLKPHDIVLRDDVLVTLEWVGSEGENKKGEGIYFPLSLLSKGTYFKPSSQAKFKKHSGLGVGFNIDVKF